MRCRQTLVLLNVLFDKGLIIAIGVFLPSSYPSLTPVSTYFFSSIPWGTGYPDVSMCVVVPLFDLLGITCPLHVLQPPFSYSIPIILTFLNNWFYRISCHFLLCIWTQPTETFLQYFKKLSNFSFFHSAADKDDSSEDLSVPSSPHTEAIQHSSVSTSNGVSSTSKAEAVATSVLTQMADQSTEPALSQIVMAPSSQAQPSGSWLETCSAAVLDTH